MLQLHFPTYDFKFKSSENKTYIWDDIRKKYLLLTPEEWVRQHAVRYLIEEKHYSPVMMAIEKTIFYQRNSQKSRYCGV
jgi:hypothetical protein